MEFTGKAEENLHPSYVFPAIRGIQAGREYYVVMCLLRLIPKIFVFNEEELRPELRAQRTMNRTRIPEITRYIVDNPTSYIFSALTASIDGRVSFSPAGGASAYNVGTLSIPMTASILINDGQHRRAAIEEAVRQIPEVGDESIAVVLFVDAGLERSQQMFADLNTHSLRPSLSIGILYDHRDPVADLARELLTTVPIFRDRIELEKTTISNRSTKLFTLSALYQATEEFIQGVAESSCDIPKSPQQLRSSMHQYWSALSESIGEWGRVLSNTVSPAELRAEYIHAHGIALQALGRAGGSLVTTAPNDWGSRLAPLTGVDWRRTNVALWEGRALVEGRVSKARRHVLLTTNVIKNALGVPLNDAELAAETELTTGATRGVDQDTAQRKERVR